MAVSTSLSAHNYLEAPENPEEPVIIPNILVSRAAYRILGAGEVHEYRFEAEEGEEIYIQITIPFLEHLKDYSPAFTLALQESRGFPVLDPAESWPSLEVKKGIIAKIEENRVMVVSDGSTDYFKEHVTGTEYWVRQELTLPAPSTGRYSIYVFHETGGEGKYVLATGKKEKFSFGDIVRLPSVRITVRKFMEKPVAGDYIFLTILGLAAAGGLAYGGYRIYQRMRR